MLSKNKIFYSALIFLTVFSSVPALHAVTNPDPDLIYSSAPIFPHMLFTETITNWRRAESSQPYWVHTSEELEDLDLLASYQISFLLNNDILAFYGHPNSRNMGILGRYSIEELDQRLTTLAAEYEAASGGRRVQKAFYLIYGTVWPQGDIGILRHDIVMRYIEYGLRNDILVFIDHQIGRFDPIACLQRMLPYLQYPNVHLALDPEWRTERPGLELGHVTAEEINRAQQVMEEYIINNNIPGERLLVFHQFNHVMIRNRQNVISNFNRVRLIHCADGIGTPAMKRASYAMNARADNMPLKAFKLFYNFEIPGAGVDRPLMTPREVYDLDPRPYIIMYQ